MMRNYFLLLMVSMGLFIAGSNANHPIIQTDLYRSAQDDKLDSYTLQNVDMADIIGSIKYLHTEVIIESLLPVVRTTRKYGINSVTKYRFKVKNPEFMTRNEVDPPQPAFLPVVTQNVDFGPFVTFDFGKSTNDIHIPTLQNYGDFVGVQVQNDPRFAFNAPFFWYSLSGFCPNFPYICDDTVTWACSETKGSPEQPNADCMKYHFTGKVSGPELDFAETNEPIMGGLCPPGQDPTGEKGCTYNYAKVATINLDILSGLTEVECGDRKCKNYKDFRYYCTDERFKKKFMGGRVVFSAKCVEYDLHPSCLGSCFDPACLALKPEDKEVGLAFWKGRCAGDSNKHRAEVFSKALGVEDATMSHNLVDSDLRVDAVASPTCVYVPGPCEPQLGKGGPYCTRQWSGVCSTCYIPNTIEPYGNPADSPYCPYDILKTVDYNDARGYEPPICRTRDPADLCCIYTGTCKGGMKNIDAATVLLDNQGFQSVAYLRNTDIMATFLKRIAEQEQITISNEDVNRFAYYQWDAGPFRWKSFDDVKANLKSFSLVGDKPALLFGSSLAGADETGTEPNQVLMVVSIINLDHTKIPDDPTPLAQAYAKVVDKYLGDSISLENIIGGCIPAEVQITKYYDDPKDVPASECTKPTPAVVATTTPAVVAGTEAPAATETEAPAATETEAPAAEDVRRLADETKSSLVFYVQTDKTEEDLRKLLHVDGFIEDISAKTDELAPDAKAGDMKLASVDGPTTQRSYEAEESSGLPVWAWFVIGGAVLLCVSGVFVVAMKQSKGAKKKKRKTRGLAAQSQEEPAPLPEVSEVRSLQAIPTVSTVIPMVQQQPQIYQYPQTFAQQTVASPYTYSQPQYTQAQAYMQPMSSPIVYR